MNPIHTILCPVDLSSFSAREVELAVEAARAFGAELVLHHNLPSTGFGLAKAWEWRQNHPKAAVARRAEAKMTELLATVPKDVRARSLITYGPLTLGIAQMAEELPADLVLLACHGWSTEDHSSLTETLLHYCPCPILALHEGEDRAWSLHLGEARERPLRLLVPTDFSPAGLEAVRYASHLAEQLSAELHLLHALGGDRSPIRALFSMAPVGASDFSVSGGDEEEAEAAERSEIESRLVALVPEGLGVRTVPHVAAGRPDEAILRLAEVMAPDLIVMGEHARDLFRRFFTRDTARDILHRATCPVWFVPPPQMAA